MKLEERSYLELADVKASVIYFLRIVLSNLIWLLQLLKFQDLHKLTNLAKILDVHLAKLNCTPNSIRFLFLSTPLCLPN